MKLSEAPPAGWYPDPVGGTRLRWWDGTDWSDRFRSRPAIRWEAEAPLGSGSGGTPITGDHRRLVEDVTTQARQAVREEIERATQVVSARVRAETRRIEPLISGYTNRLLRWLKIVLGVALVVVIGWIAFELFATRSLFTWLGDRIDALTDR